MGLDNNLKKMQADREAQFGLKPAKPAATGAKPGPQAKAPAKPSATPPKK